MARSRPVLQRADVRAVDELLGLMLAEPVADALRLGAADVADPLRRGRIEQACVGGLPGQLASREPQIDAGRGQAARLGVGAEALHSGTNECAGLDRTLQHPVDCSFVK